MRILIFGGTGFVGLNIAAALLARGHAVTLFDRAGLPPAAQRVLAPYADRLTTVQGDVTDRQIVEEAIGRGYEAIVLGATITAGAEREAADPEAILRVNLLAHVPVLSAARRSGVGRIINLSSGSAYGTSAFCIPASFADWPRQMKRPRSICTVRPTARRFRSSGWRKSSAGARGSAAPNRPPTSAFGGRSIERA